MLQYKKMHATLLTLLYKQQKNSLWNMSDNVLNYFNTSSISAPPPIDSSTILSPALLTGSALTILRSVGSAIFWTIGFNPPFNCDNISFVRSKRFSTWRLVGSPPSDRTCASLISFLPSSPTCCFSAKRIDGGRVSYGFKAIGPFIDDPRELAANRRVKIMRIETKTTRK